MYHHATQLCYNVEFIFDLRQFDSGGIRTHATEVTGALNQRLRPLGHAIMAYPWTLNEFNMIIVPSDRSFLDTK